MLHQGASRNRWTTIHWNASRPLHQAIAEQRAGVVRQLRGTLRRAALRLDGGVDLKAAPAGVGAEARLRVGSDAQRASSAYGMLAELGQLGARRHGVIIIAADELQAASTDDLQELTAAIQQLANVQALPVCLVAVGLPATGPCLRSARVSPGFAERLVPLRVETLDPAATRDALATPFDDAGRDIEPAAVEPLVTAKAAILRHPARRSRLLASRRRHRSGHHHPRPSSQYDTSRALSTFRSTNRARERHELERPAIPRPPPPNCATTTRSSPAPPIAQRLGTARTSPVTRNRDRSSTSTTPCAPTNADESSSPSQAWRHGSVDTPAKQLATSSRPKTDDSCTCNVARTQVQAAARSDLVVPRAPLV